MTKRVLKLKGRAVLSNRTVARFLRMYVNDSQDVVDIAAWDGLIGPECEHNRPIMLFMENRARYTAVGADALNW